MPPLEYRINYYSDNFLGSFLLFGRRIWTRFASKYLKAPEEWPKIYKINKKNINDPNKIYPGQVIEIPQEMLESATNVYPNVDTLLTQDPPEHRRYRSLVGGAFSPGRVSKLRDTMKQLANDLVDGFVGSGRIELISQYASPFPLTPWPASE